ncbi:23S rRNA-associated protein [sediment metagenome]|uniref:23S rRNA-associated protein n=1 Tax=sediment metagenome TaxID=749907 RepID=D9PIF6_9ZZZZ
MAAKFGFEELEVWQKAVEFARKIIDLTENMNTGRRRFRLLDQVETSAASIAMNIAEGKGRYSKKEYMQFLYIARGSLYETVTLLNIFQRNKWIDKICEDNLRSGAVEIGKMLSGLIFAIRKSL